jgi:RNA polymerase sigma-70 factor (ECF subfamily)
MDEWDELIRAHGPAVWRTICRLLGGDAEAADCFQETFLELMRRFTLSSVKNPEALLKRIATRRAIDQIRRRSRARRQEVLLSDVHSAQDQPPDSAAELNDLAQQLSIALKELPEAQAGAFCLTQLEGMSNPEAAEALGVSIAHLGVLLHRARSRLRLLLADLDPAHSR